MKLIWHSYLVCSLGNRIHKTPAETGLICWKTGIIRVSLSCHVSEAPRWEKKDSGLVRSIAWKKTSARVWERETYALVTAENDHCLCAEFSSMQKD